MLPAIYFVFSRAGCDRSVQWLRESGIRLTTRAEADRIRDRAESRAAWIDEEDLVTLGFYDFLDGLTAGVAAHHAGMLPVFKETVEELFEAGLVKVVFATETLSLGINMPARTVVIEDLWKFQGERHEILTPGEYTQLTGRAGRRGIDQLGHAVVVYQRQVPFERVAGLAATRTYDLNSSFRPSYNMAVNLVRNYSREQAHQLLNSSFAQFLADRGVVAAGAPARARPGVARGIPDEPRMRPRRLRRVLGSAARGASGSARRTAAAASGTRVEAIRTVVAGLRPGEVIHVPRARRRGLAVVLSSRDGKPTVLSRGPVVLPALRQGLRRSAHRADPDRAAAVGELPERAVPPRRGGSKLVSLHVKRPREAPRTRPTRRSSEKAAALEARAAEHTRALVPRAREARAVGRAGGRRWRRS